MELYICDGCGLETDDEFDLEDTEHYGSLCEDCWHEAAEADPTMYFERVQ